MPRFDCTIEFTLRTTIEPEGVYFDTYGVDGVEDFQEDSSWYEADVSSDGGRLTCIIVADSEDEASEKAAEILNEGSEVEDRNGFTWLIEDVNVTLDEIEEPMTMERAEAILIGLAESQSRPEVKEAVEFVFDEFERIGSKIQALGTEVGELSHKLRDAELKVAELAGELDRIRNGPDGSEESA